MNLDNFLQRHHIPRAELARSLGIHRSAVTRWMSGTSLMNQDQVSATLTFCRQYDPAVTYEDLFGAPELPIAVGE